MSKILVVDDDDQVRKMLLQSLEREGYKVVTAPDGMVGIELFREQGADLIITDIFMPEKEGLETIKELRQNFPDVKIIAISGGGRLDPNDYLDMARKFGAQITLAKPFDREELLEAVNAVLE